jgi:hypothetical protein
VADDVLDTLRSVLVEVARRGDTISYEALLDALAAFDPELARAAQSELASLLRAVSAAEDDSGRGLLTAVVVRSDTGMPGTGFFRLAEERGRTVADRQSAWTTELAAVHAAHSRPG